MRLEVAVIVPFANAAGPLVLRSRAAGETVRLAVLGPTGVGKTTLLRVIAGLECRARGLVRFGEQVWLDDSRGACVPAHERPVGWVPQESLLFPHLSVRRNLEFSPRADAGLVDELVRRFELAPLLERSVRALSGGERQRVALARALASRPRLLLLDEAFSAQNRELRRKTQAALDRYCVERCISLVLVTHDMADAQALGCETLDLGDLGEQDEGQKKTLDAISRIERFSVFPIREN